MSALRQTLADYLAVRRALGYKLERAEKLLGQFLDYLHDEDAHTVTVEHALAWATAPAGDPWWHALRLNAVRPFAVYLHARDPRHEVPPAGLIRYGSSRATPYLYSPAQIDALVATARQLPFPLHALVYPVLIGLLAVTGMRVGETLALQDQDVDAQQGIVTVRDGKFGKSRLLPVHPSTIDALLRYRQAREQFVPATVVRALFVSSSGGPMDRPNVGRTFRQIAKNAGVTARSAACRPRVHDLRHSFAVATLLDAYRNGDDVQAMLPRLSTYLGHVKPKDTYWYLSAAPELLGLAGERLERHLNTGEAA
ncbi:tyrosine-type recombinase/integrase [Actinoplanes derwentensis]|uniref:Site-specific recombinase XerD n=1 Tax=Actinoplanes derwentensis TaxID=113562 RepID=A0A1H1XSC8_9ACTN|nr:tyrosine-type recombinase/integrase [Actinoplanes derwentensis]GID89200.1 putative integrase/recombinase y4rB [Actinoplanes derwentensis]SDT12158.1 Site-specific recombinase XerD [Actinoplanes derwentensis]